MRHIAAHRGSLFWIATALMGVVTIPGGLIVLIAAPSYAGAAAAPSWGPPTEISTTGEFSAISCNDALDCTAVSRNASVVTETSGTWGTPTVISGMGGGSLNGVSCAAVTDCTAVGNVGNGLPFYVDETSGVWGTPVEVTDIPGGSGAFNSVSCAHASDCTAVGSDGNDLPFYDTETAGTWGTPVEVSNAPFDSAFYSVSCTDATDCTAVGGADDLPFYDTETGGSWGGAAAISDTPGGSGYFYGVSCPDASDCTAVGYASNYGGAPIYASEVGGTWGTPVVLPTVGGGYTLWGVSCSDAIDCTAVGNAHYNEPIYVSETVGTWGSVSELTGVPSGAGRLDGVSCTQAAECTAVGLDENDGTGIYATSGDSGTITLGRSTGLIGHYADRVSGSGWTVNHDTSVTMNECATTYYAPSSCDGANQVNVTLRTGTKAGTFKKASIDIVTGTIDPDGDACGVTGSSPCYLVVVGNSGDFTSDVLGFTLPSASVTEATGVAKNYVDDVTAIDFPVGDTVTARECDTSVNPATNLATNCDTAKMISGTVGPSGSVLFSPAGVKIRVGAGYVETGSGSVVQGGRADIVVDDSTTSGVWVVIPIILASRGA